MATMEAGRRRGHWGPRRWGALLTTKMGPDSKHTDGHRRRVDHTHKPLLPGTKQTDTYATALDERWAHQIRQIPFPPLIAQKGSCMPHTTSLTAEMSGFAPTPPVSFGLVPVHW